MRRQELLSGQRDHAHHGRRLRGEGRKGSLSFALRGHGIGLRSRHYGRLLDASSRDRADELGVDWFEIISENFFEPGGRPWAVLDAVRAKWPVAVHGVSLCIGDAAPPSEEYLDRLARLCARVEPACVSDHLCWGTSDGRYAHDLLPLPYTDEALARVVAKLDAVQTRLGRAILLENVSSYVAFADSAVPEWEFLNEVARRSGCGILLDVNNVYVSAANHGFDANAYLDSVDIARVGQIHLAGHTDMTDYLFDTHVGPVPEAVWSLYRRVVRRRRAAGLAPVPTLVEWDEDVPELETVAAEATRARAIEREELGR